MSERLYATEERRVLLADCRPSACHRRMTWRRETSNNSGIVRNESAQEYDAIIPVTHDPAFLVTGRNELDDVTANQWPYVLFCRNLRRRQRLTLAGAKIVVLKYYRSERADINKIRGAISTGV